MSGVFLWPIEQGLPEQFMSDDVQDIEEQAPPPLSDGVDENSDGAKAGATVLKKESTASAKSKRAILNNEIEILADQPLPQYDNGAAKAYNAQALGSEAKQQIRIFAYVCAKGYRIFKIQCKCLKSLGIIIYPCDNVETCLFEA